MQAKQQKPVVYRECGSGPALVLIHGMSANVDHWLGFDQLLAKNFRVITFNNRGFGDSPQPSTWSMTIEQMAGDVIEILDYLKIETAHIFGISMGGMVAMALAMHYPHRCKSLTILNSSLGSRLNRLSRTAIEHLAGASWKLLRAPLSVGVWERRVGLYLGHNPSPELRRSLAKTLLVIKREQKNGLSNRLKQYLAISRFTAEHRLKAISVPTLIIKGTHDRIVPPPHSDFLARMIPGAQLLVMEHAGHVPIFDRAEELRDILVTWLEKR